MLKIQSYCYFDKVKYFLSKFCGSGIQWQVMSVSGAVQVGEEKYSIGVILHKVHVTKIRKN